MDGGSTRLRLKVLRVKGEEGFGSAEEICMFRWLLSVVSMLDWGGMMVST